ncbi:MAG: ketopantoate reductase family protein [Terriglobia bacterium]
MEENKENGWPKIAVMGAGAIGCYFGGMLARAGAPVTLIGRPRHVDAIQRHGLQLDAMQFAARIPVCASTEPSAAADASIVLFCVKTFDTEGAARTLAPHLRTGAAVLSLQNGVDNVERMRAAAGLKAIAGAVYVAAEMVEPGRVKHNGRGDLILGHLSEDRGAEGEPNLEDSDVQAIASVFVRAGVPCGITERIETELWRKLIINCAYNAISAVTQARYSRLAGNSWTRQIIIEAIRESVAVARAAGVRLPEDDMVAAGLEISETMAAATSSMAQDLARGAHTEIDSLNGYIARRSAELGVATPINQTLHALVKLLEESAQAGAF